MGVSSQGESARDPGARPDVDHDPSAAIAACVSGYGVFQSLELGMGPWLRSGKLVQIPSDWCDEGYPLYAYYRSRHLPPAKIRAFLDFVKEIVSEETAAQAQ